MIVFKNLNPIEVNEGDGQITIEIDAGASGITDIHDLEGIAYYALPATI